MQNRRRLSLGLPARLPADQVGLAYLEQSVIVGLDLRLGPDYRPTCALAGL